MHHNPKTEYQAIEIASEPVTFVDEWYKVPNMTMFWVAEDYRLGMEPLGRQFSN